MKQFEELTLINYCHPDCTPLLNIMRLPKQEAFRLAKELAAAHPETTAFYRFGDFDNYYALREAQDKYLYSKFIELGGVPKEEHPLSFVIEGSEYLKEWFGNGIETRLPLKDIVSCHISFTIGDSGAEYDRNGSVDLLTLEELRRRMDEYGGDFEAFLSATGRHYIEVQLWSDEYLENKGEKKMEILVLGGTRFFGIHMVDALLEAGHDVTIATRGKVEDDFGDRVKRIVFERTSAESVKESIGDRHYDVVIDKLAYCSNDIKYVMDAVNCDKYIHTSTTAVYEPKHINTLEEEFDVYGKELVWCDRQAFPYDEIKRQAEYALYQIYPGKNWAAVRFPFVIGEDDYTERLLFYVEHTMKAIPMHIDNLECQMGFIRSDEAGKFMAFLAEQDFKGAINGSTKGTISVKEIIEYVEEKTGTHAVLSDEGEEAPYNGEPDYTINTDIAAELGFTFSNLKDWIYELLDYYIEEVKKEGSTWISND